MAEPVVTSEKLMALSHSATSLAARRRALESSGGDVEEAAALLERLGRKRAESRQHQPVRLGDEEPNDDVRQRFDRIVQRQNSRSDPIGHYLAFDFGQKIMALTRNRMLIITNGGVETSFAYGSVSDVPDTGHDREIALVDGIDHRHTFRVGDANVAALVRRMLRSRIRAANTPGKTPENGLDSASYGASERSENGDGTDTAPGIADRVRFWEEQDRINRELIPRVIRQHELLTQHIGEHENLPEVAGQAIANALAEAREQQRRQFVEALDVARTELAEETDARLSRVFDQMQAASDLAKDELTDHTANTLAQALVDLQSALVAHKTELDQQTEARLTHALAAVQQEARKTRNLLIGITAGSAAISIALIIVNFVIG